MEHEVNRNLKARIVLHYGSQANFSMAVKEDETLVSRVVNNRRTLDADKRKKWASALGVSSKEIFPDANRKN